MNNDTRYYDTVESVGDDPVSYILTRIRIRIPGRICEYISPKRGVYACSLERLSRVLPSDKPVSRRCRIGILAPATSHAGEVSS